MRILTSAQDRLLEKRTPPGARIAATLTAIREEEYPRKPPIPVPEIWKLPHAGGLFNAFAVIVGQSGERQRRRPFHHYKTGQSTLWHIA